MRRQHFLLVSVALVGVEAMLNGSAFGFGGNSDTVCLQPVGANLITGDLQSSVNYVAENIGGAWFDAFSFGHTDCNVGDANSLHQAFASNLHPAYAPGLFKLKNGRIEQIGMGWLFHGFAALTQNLCCTCNGAGGSVVGVGCSNPYVSTGSQGGLGPRWQINAYTGYFPTGGPANPPYSGTTARRVRVRSAELEPSSASVKYFAEYMTVAQQESTLGNEYDNASYRPVTITGGPDNFAVALAGTTLREQPAIRAWKASDPAVVETNIQLPDEGLFILAAKATQVSGNVWNYEYALYNFNSDLSGRAFRVPLPPGAVVTNIGFHDVDYHSGDAMNNFTDPNLNFSGADWQVAITNNSIEWSSETYAQNINANALRWGTMHNFRFDVNRPPAPPQAGGLITLTTYKVAGSVTGGPTVVPGPPPCPPDINNSGSVDVNDLLAVINSWGPCVPGNCPADITGDGEVNVNDLLAVLGSWGPCP